VSVDQQPSTGDQSMTLCLKDGDSHRIRAGGLLADLEGALKVQDRADDIALPTSSAL
jgi:hypothetical protein